MKNIFSLLLFSLMISACTSETVEFPVGQSSEEKAEEAAGRSLSAALYRPGNNAFQSPAVVLMHGCAGVLNKHEDWAEQLSDWGYVALVVDSFSPRRVKRICEANNEVWADFDRLRPQDAQAALKYLRSLPEVDPARVGIMGWSYGGTTTLNLIESSKKPADLDFTAAVAMYPSCWQFLQSFDNQSFNASNPLLIAMGEKDDWTRPEHCEQLVSQQSTNSASVSLKQYPDAFHDFDNSRQPVVKLLGVRIEDEAEYGDVIIGYNRTAHRAVLEDVKKFFKQNL